MLDPVGDHAGTVRLDLDAHVVINRALHRYQYFHAFPSLVVDLENLTADYADGRRL